jgi:hypothetical protein
MMRRFAYVVGACLVGLGLAGVLRSETKVTWTGWFSDASCSAARATSGILTATNPDCAKRCIEKGEAPVFISEQAKAIFKIKDYPKVIDDLGYHVEVTATVDEAAKTISVREVKRLSYEGAACGRPKKTSNKQ